MRKHVIWRTLAAGVMLTGLILQIACSDSDKTAELESVTVYKSPNCGCCSKWVRHLQDSGFEVEAINRPDMNSIKTETGIPRQLTSCHTALGEGYVIEGHVPATDIRRLLKERPDVAGLAVPGMPMGSPGMEGPRQEHYDVLTFSRTGETTVFSRY